MSYTITESVTWVGKIDWTLRRFHGEELSTHRGSSYNSYLIRDEKTVLIDTVWGPFAKEFVANLKQEIDLKEIDYIISLHGETDHSGALSELLREIPNTPVYCTANGVKSLQGQYHGLWNFVPVKTGDVLDLGKKQLHFIEARMLHWPDTMFAYLTGENILFSSDGFGQHYASEMMYDDLVDQGELWYEAMKYYANILNPFSPLVDKKIAEILGMNLPVSLICPAHGVIWRKQINEIIQAYVNWSRCYQENQATIAYDSMWHGTEHLANAFCEGLREGKPDLVVKCYYMGKSDANDVLTEIFKSKLVLLGSPTVNRGILSPMAALVSHMKELGFKNKKGMAFGTYGWSGESVKILSDALQESCFELVHEGFRTTWDPDEEALAAAKEIGRQIAATL